MELSIDGLMELYEPDAALIAHVIDNAWGDQAEST